MEPKTTKPDPHAKNEIVVFWIIRPAQCSECGDELPKGGVLRLEQEKALCMECADLDHLEFLPSGDQAVTRRASKYSTLRAVVVRWSRTRKRYERQGILVEADAICRAEEESLADAEVRARRQARAAEKRLVEDQEYIAAFARSLRELYPGCPRKEATKIAEHACRKYSGRVGRSAAAKEFRPEAIRLAVIAHIRHTHTNYDGLLARYGDRELARSMIHDQLDTVIDEWRAPDGPE